jgi:hypothetical protein
MLDEERDETGERLIGSSLSAATRKTALPFPNFAWNEVCAILAPRCRTLRPLETQLLPSAG